MISFLPGLKSAGGTEEILRNTIGERVLGLPPEPRLDKGIPFSELRAKEKEAAAGMDLALTDEQEFLREAARGALSRFKTIEAAREALDDGRRAARPVARRARGRLGRAAGLRGARRRRPRRVRRHARRSPRPAACSRRVPLLGLLPATALLDAAAATPSCSRALAAGELRAACARAPARRPRARLDRRRPRRGARAPRAPTIEGGGDASRGTGARLGARRARRRPAGRRRRRRDGRGGRGGRRGRHRRAGRRATT